MAKTTGSTKFRWAIATVLLALSVLLFSPFLPWWGFILFGLAIGVWTNLEDLDSFLAGFLGAFLPFLIKMTLLNTANESILADKMATTVNLPGAVSLIVFTAIVCGVLGGLALWTGSLLRKLLPVMD